MNILLFYINFFLVDCLDICWNSRIHKQDHLFLLSSNLMKIHFITSTIYLSWPLHTLKIFLLLLPLWNSKTNFIYKWYQTLIILKDLMKYITLFMLICLFFTVRTKESYLEMFEKCMSLEEEECKKKKMDLIVVGPKPS